MATCLHSGDDTTNVPDSPSSLDVAEIAISYAWHGRRIPDDLSTTDGRPLRIIHRGTWSHGLGPDFRDAMIEFDGRRLVTGAVEMHRQTSGWREHGHDSDPRYNDVVLHVVVQHDAIETRRQDGALVPTVVVSVAYMATEQNQAVDWSRFGGTVCAEEFTARSPELVRSVIWRLGDVRLAAKAARFEARLSSVEPSEVLYQEVWDGLGYSANRKPMRLVASTLRLAALERTLSFVDDRERISVCLGLMFGVAGFLPLSPSDANHAHLNPNDINALEHAWTTHGSAWKFETISPLAWTRARVRPANHPIRRLAAGSALLANAHGGIATVLLDAIKNGDDSVRLLQELSASPSEIAIGKDRAVAIVANAVIPFALALAEHTGDVQLSEAASTAWEQLPSAGLNEVTRRALRQVAGAAKLTGLGSRGEQGLIQLDSALCAPRRCRECPIAAMVVSREP